MTRIKDVESGHAVAQYAIDGCCIGCHSPDRVEKHGWNSAKLKKITYQLQQLPEPSASVTCRDSVAHAAITHGKDDAHALKHRLNVDRDSTCIGWRKTGGCDPDGPREKEQDKSCSAKISADWSGYCECGAGRKHKFACGHEPVSCSDACKVTFPFVIAQSGERVWTNQFARNLLLTHGDWMTSGTKNQWVVFDLGWVRQVRVMHFKLWGSRATPRHVRIGTSSHHLGPWKKVDEIELPTDKTTFTSDAHRKLACALLAAVHGGQLGCLMGHGIESSAVCWPN